MEIRPLQRTDIENGFIETLENLYVPTFSHLKRESIDKEEAYNLFDRIERDLSSHYFVYVAVENGQVVGTATLQIDEKFIHNCHPSARIENVSTREGHEGKGIASAIIAEIEEEARDMRCYKITLNCTDKVMPFYEKNGYRKANNEMRKDLEPPKH